MAWELLIVKKNGAENALRTLRDHRLMDIEAESYSFALLPCQPLASSQLWSSEKIASRLKPILPAQYARCPEWQTRRTSPWTLSHQLIPLVPRSMRDERGGHLHGAAPRVAFQLWVLLRLRLHPGLGGLPPGPAQWCHLCDLAETWMRRLDRLSEALECTRGREEGTKKIGREKPNQQKELAKHPNSSQTKQKAVEGGDCCWSKMYIISMVYKTYL